VLAAPLSQPDDERVQFLVRLESYVGLDRAVLAMEDVEGDPHPIAGAVLHVGVDHHGVDYPVPDEVAAQVIVDALPGLQGQGDTYRLQQLIGNRAEDALLLPAQLVIGLVDGQHHAVLQHLQQDALVLGEGRLDDLIQVL